VARRIRIAILLCILFGVVLYAIKDIRSRRERNTWERSVDVAIVIVHVDGTPAVDRSVLDAFTARTDVLGARLTAEMARYRTGSPLVPFRFHVKGPVSTASAVPPPPTGDGIVDLAKHSRAITKWAEDIDERGGIVESMYDSRIYVLAKKASAIDDAFVEGQSELGGRLGFVEVELDAGMVDLAEIVVAHELFHTLGATDKYDASGHVRHPEGYVEPNAVPLHPQRFAEIMARNRPTGPNQEAVPDTLDELGVGAATAEEIGWLKSK